VTGAEGGIGQAICARFLEEGAQVAATDIDLSGAGDVVSRAPEGQAIALQCDASDSDSVREAIGQAAATFGRLNVLCSVAGGSSLQDGIITEASEEEFWH
jgi:NAD(P)-dependent dehydrogenase (short-subunit alcohol dehydrogenase family)